MAKYQVTIKETLTYVVDVIADNEQDAEDIAFGYKEFRTDVFRENDARVSNVVTLTNVDMELGGIEKK